jgi:hypothetical protein
VRGVALRQGLGADELAAHIADVALALADQLPDYLDALRGEPLAERGAKLRFFAQLTDADLAEVLREGDVPPEVLLEELFERYGGGGGGASSAAQPAGAAAAAAAVAQKQNKGR